MFATKRLVLLIAVISVLCAIVVPANSDTISGIVTVDGGGPIAGAMVRTDGDPSYSAVTGSNGSYSITNLPASVNGEVWAVLAAKTGYNPQRLVVSTGGATAVANFALRPQAATVRPLILPAPLSFGEPPSAPTAPGDNYPVSFADTGALPDPNAPKIADHNDCVKPDESFTMSGCNFTTRTGADAGTDTTVWVWARTWSAGGVLRQARLWKVSATTITATLPDDVPFGMYLVWVQNSVGVSAPTCLNRTTPTWTGLGSYGIGTAIGPIDNIAYPGGTKRVFGRNLTYNHSVTRANSSDPATSYVYIQPAAGGAFIACPTTTPVPASAPNIYEPYAVMFTVPIGTPNGNYKVFVHNGHGGVYGWSDGLNLIVQDRWQRGSGIVTVNPGTDPSRNDTTAIQAALNTVAGYANGGTVQLGSGSFILRTPISIPANVELAGAGMDSTTLLLEAPPNGTENVPWYSTGSFYGPTKTPDAVVMNGNRGALSNLRIHQVQGFGIANSELNVPGTTVGAVISGVHITSDQGYTGWENMSAGSWLGAQTEVSGCVTQRDMMAQGRCWLHDNTFYGDAGPWWGAEAPCEIYGFNNVYEQNHTETQNWPIQANGSPNYRWQDYYYKPWAKRVAMANTSNAYIGHNTAKDVAVDDNRGEMILMHPLYGQYWGQVLSCDGLTMTVRTDGKLFDQAVDPLDNYNAGSLPASQPLTTDLPWWQWYSGRYVEIISGRGAGQVRPVQSWWTAGSGYGIEPPNKMRVASPWTVAPDSTSVIIMGCQCAENTVYGNTLNAFPPNYNLTTAPNGSASCPTQMGNSYRGVYEANISRRTNGGPIVVAHATSPCMWNDMRDNQTIDAMSSGYALEMISNNPIAPCLYGNAIRSSSCNITLPCSGYSGGVLTTGEGNILENLTLSAGMGYYVGFLLNGELNGIGSPNLYRNGRVTAGNAPYQPVFVRSMTGGSLLVNNTYSGSSQNYYYNTGLSSYSVPIANYRVARFTAYTGSPAAQDALIPIVNAGTADMTWTVTASDPWITGNVQSNGILSPESASGRLSVGVNPSSLGVGHYSGSVTVNTGASSVKVGVELDVVSGMPPSAPKAAFSASPVAGTAPRSVDFNAGASTGSGLSYYWDFGDGSYGSGTIVSHTYAQGTFTPVLTVTDAFGLTDQSWTNIAVSPTLTDVNVTGSPGAPVDSPSTTVTLTATAVGGYQPQYKFLVNGGNGWTVLRDYQASAACDWTPGVSGYYQVKVYAKATDSTKAYDVVSSVLSYPVGQLPGSGIRLWLRADSGVTKDAGNFVSGWADQSGVGNNVTQSSSPKQPSYVDNVVNGLPVIRFGGGGQMLQNNACVLTGSTSFTTIEVVKLNSFPGTSYQYIWWNGQDTQTGGYGSWFITTNQKMRNGWSSSGYWKTIAPVASVVGTWQNVVTRYTAGTGVHEMWYNGAYNGSAMNTSGSNLGGGTFTVGNFGPSASQGFYGDIQELIIYNRNLSDTEIANATSYLTARLTPPAAIVLDRLKDVKALGDGVLVSITSAKVATVRSGMYSDGSVYVEETDRTAGMKILNAGAVNTGDNLTLSGTTDTDAVTGERILRVTGVSTGANTPLVPLGMANKAFATNGQMVRVWGKVTVKTGSYITIDDGSGIPVKTQVDGLVSAITKIVNIGDYISVTGPAGLASGGIAVVRPSSDADIQVY